MRILITGGAGYLGSVMTPALLALGHEVTVLDKFMYRQNSLLDWCYHPGLEIARGDCRDESVLKPLVARADAIIPLAALVGAPLCEQDQTAAQTTNLDAIILLCKLASKTQRIVMPATNCGYGIGEKDK